MVPNLSKWHRGGVSVVCSLEARLRGLWPGETSFDLAFDLHRLLFSNCGWSEGDLLERDVPNNYFLMIHHSGALWDPFWHQSGLEFRVTTRHYIPYNTIYCIYNRFFSWHFRTFFAQGNIMCLSLFLALVCLTCCFCGYVFWHPWVLWLVAVLAPVASAAFGFWWLVWFCVCLVLDCFWWFSRILMARFW